ncbi:MAG: histidine phosphatase family protein [Marinoscillum sp.]
MVRNLYLLRHGQAAVEYGLRDFDRPLTIAGNHQLTALGIRLKKNGFYPDKIYSSPSKRTRETSGILTKELNYSLPVDFVDGIYEASLKTLFDLVTDLDDAYNSIMIIGHNPAISYLFDYLTDRDHIGMTPGELIHIEFENLSWSEVSKGLGNKKRI